MSNSNVLRSECVIVKEPLRVIADGFQFTEGPAWHPIDQYLIFSDIPASRTYCWHESLGLSVVRHESQKTNGNAYDKQGRLISCEHSTSRVVRTEAEGSFTVLADRYDGKELNSPNDVIVASDGTIYFTDPVYGRTLESVGRVRPVELSVRGVYRLTPAGELSLIIDNLLGPNGLCLSLDESLLYVNDSERGHIKRFHLSGDQVEGGEAWAQPKGARPGSVDGMKVDSLDNVYCTGPGGVFVYDRSGELLSVIDVPEVVGNFTWGGKDLKSLFVCATSKVYVCRMTVPGLAAF